MPLGILAWRQAESFAGWTPPLDNILAVLAQFLLGLATGVAAGNTLALIAWLSRIGEDAVGSAVQVLRTLPHLARCR